MEGGRILQVSGNCPQFATWLASDYPDPDILTTDHQIP